MEEVSIKQFLDNIESSYSIFDSMFNIDIDQFLSLGDKIIDGNVLPDLDIPLSALQYLEFMKE